MSYQNLGESGKASFLIDGQFGSTGKGLAAGYIGSKESFDVVTTNASANAGHTVVWKDEKTDEELKFVAFHLPITVLMQQLTQGVSGMAYLNAGAIIDPVILMAELEHARKLFGFTGSQLAIHPRAAIIDPVLDTALEREAGSAATKLGSTQKGVGSALSRKIGRGQDVRLARDVPELQPYVRELDLNLILDRGDRVLVEVPQGFSLGINSGCSYPYCTSREVTVMQAASDALIHPHFVGQTMMTLRTFPIRVGHVYDEQGNKVGDSGPGYPDQKELTWSEDFPKIEPERTTVTKRVRRIFEWSELQFIAATRVNRPDKFFLNFVNYLDGDSEKLFNILTQIHSGRGRNSKVYLGMGPDISDVWSGSYSSFLERYKWLSPKNQ